MFFFYTGICLAVILNISTCFLTPAAVVALAAVAGTNSLPVSPLSEENVVDAPGAGDDFEAITVKSNSFVFRIRMEQKQRRVVFSRVLLDDVLEEVFLFA